jgi:hypothetical protein
MDPKSVLDSARASVAVTEVIGSIRELDKKRRDHSPSGATPPPRRSAQPGSSHRYVPQFCISALYSMIVSHFPLAHPLAHPFHPSPPFLVLPVSCASCPTACRPPLYRHSSHLPCIPRRREPPRCRGAVLSRGFHTGMCISYVFPPSTECPSLPLLSPTSRHHLRPLATLPCPNARSPSCPCPSPSSRRTLISAHAHLGAPSSQHTLLSAHTLSPFPLLSLSWAR